MKRRGSNAQCAAMLLMLMHLSACSNLEESGGTSMNLQAECPQYRPFLEEDVMRSKLVEWADSNVFSREFSDDDFVWGHFSGPGRSLMTFDTKAGPLKIPEWLPADYEVRVVGQSKEDVRTIFITGGRYQGLIVVRDKWADSIDEKYLKHKMVVAQVGRVGLICYLDQ